MLDLYRMLHRAGCPLYLFDNVAQWVQHYSTNYTADVWHPTLWSSREKFIKDIARIFHEENARPQMKIVPCPHRKVSVAVHSFAHATMSLLADERINNTGAYLPGYDVFTGKFGNDFWDPATIDLKNSMNVPVPNDKNAPVSDMQSSYLFQGSVSRFCTEPHHVPVPIILGYDQANLTMLGDNALSPLIFSFGFLRPSVRRLAHAWRVLGYVPNLAAGVGNTDDTTADDKQIEHHLCLSEILRELKEICHAGGFKTTYGGREVVLNFFDVRHWRHQGT